MFYCGLLLKYSRYLVFSIYQSCYAQLKYLFDMFLCCEELILEKVVLAKLSGNSDLILRAKRLKLV